MGTPTHPTISLSPLIPYLIHRQVEYRPHEDDGDNGGKSNNHDQSRSKRDIARSPEVKQPRAYDPF